VQKNEEKLNRFIIKSSENVKQMLKSMDSNTKIIQRFDEVMIEKSSKIALEMLERDIRSQVASKGNFNLIII
jgi:hypothetical protein